MVMTPLWELTRTADVCDRPVAFDVCEIPMRDFGGRVEFAGRVRTVRSYEDNLLVKHVLASEGAGCVLVVDAGGSTRCTMLGDNMAEVARAHGWSGVVIHGAVRDAQALAAIDVGIKAVGTHPRRSRKDGIGQIDVPLRFGECDFRPGDWLVCDADGIVRIDGDVIDQLAVEEK